MKGTGPNPWAGVEIEYEWQMVEWWSVRDRVIAWSERPSRLAKLDQNTGWSLSAQRCSIASHS